MDVKKAAHQIERVRLELVTRRLMVMLVGLIGVWVGIAVILTGAPDFIEGWFSPWSRYALGGAALLAGGWSVFGSTIGEGKCCGWWAEVCGLAGMTAWYLSMAASYSVLVVQQGLTIVGPGVPLGEGVTGRGYVPFLYLGLALMAAIPLVMTVKLGRFEANPEPDSDVETWLGIRID